MDYPSPERTEIEYEETLLPSFGVNLFEFDDSIFVPRDSFTSCENSFLNNSPYFSPGNVCHL
jgi:hypothetical protein